jgi:hypothetical protein
MWFWFDEVKIGISEVFLSVSKIWLVCEVDMTNENEPAGYVAAGSFSFAISCGSC